MHASNPGRRPPIAIVGVSALCPGSVGAGAFWRNIFDGKDLVTDVPESHWRIADYYDPDPSAPDKTYAKRGAFLPPVPFDPLSFGIPPSTLNATDTAQLLALIAARQVLEDAARGQFRAVDRRRISVILGVASATELVVELGSRIQRPVWTNAMRAAGLSEAQVQDVCDRIASHYVPWQEASFPGLLGNVVAGRIANRLDLGGTNAVTDAACASSFAALEMGLNELYLGQSDLVISGGVDAINDIFMYMCFSKTPALSPTGDCRPYSDSADGTLLGEGLAMFALRRLEDAERDGNPIYAVIRGLGAASDGRATSIYGPRPEGQALALSRAYDAAGYSPASVELVEGHGTGTAAGDLAEVAALKRVFGDADGERGRWCALGSVKSQVGHTKAAAGALGMFKAVMGLHHKVLPPTIKVERPAPALAESDSPFYLNTRARPWIAGRAPRRAAVSSFGFGGSNFHVTLQEYTGTGRAAERFPTGGAALFLLAGASRAAVAQVAADLATKVEASADAFFAAAQASQLGFDAKAPVRAAVVADSAAALVGKLRALQTALRDANAKAPIPGVSFADEPPMGGKIAFLFPGQGSQYVGMGAGLAMNFAVARQPWDTAAAVMDDEAPPLHAVVFPQPAFDDATEQGQADALTAAAQPALALVGLSQLALLQALGVTPDMTAGHSFGEVMALHAAGAFDAETALRIARKRGDVMRTAAAASHGAMLAVSMARAEAAELLSAWALPVTIANDNAPDQVVLSGATEAIADAERRLSARGVRCVRLPVAAAFHSPQVSAATGPFAAHLADEDIAAPRLPVFGTATALPYPAGPDAVCGQLAQQLAQPVQFRAQVDALYAAGARIFVEVGPGTVLTNLVTRNLAGREGAAVALDRKGETGTTAFLEGLGRLAVLGRSIEFARLWADVRVPEPAPPPGPGTVHLLGSNFGKPYPGNMAIAAKVTEVPRAVAAPIPAPTPAVAVGGLSAEQRLAAFAAFQEQIAESQRAFQTALSESHRAFLETAQRTLEGLTSVHGGASAVELPRLPVMPPPPVLQPQAPRVAQVQAIPPPVRHVPPPAAAAKVAAPVDIAARLLGVVADKTGYPAEMLKLSMSLEADLGIDSIKQVEILAALREVLPDLPEIEPGDLGRLRTLGAIVDLLQSSVAPAPTALPVRTPAAMAPPPVANSPPIAATLLAVVAEKTGYPAEMLKLSMTLEADLGIDSIKQVEILAALRERAPQLPEVEPGDLAQLRTLGAIVDFLGGQAAAPAPNVPTPAVVAAESVARTRVLLVDAPLPTTKNPAHRRTYAIVGGPAPVAAALANALAAAGQSARVAEQVPADADAVVYLGGLTDDADATAMHWRALMTAKGAAARLASSGGRFITVQDTGGAFGFEDEAHAARGGLAGLAKCVAVEWPDVDATAIDVAVGGRSATELARVLAVEILSGAPETEVGLGRAGRRTTLSHEPARPATGAAPIGRDSVIVVSGGARGVTAATALALARAHAPRLVLLGRTPLTAEPASCASARDVAAIQAALHADRPALGPAALRTAATRMLAAREVRATLAAIEGAGSPVRYVDVDVRDADAVAAVLTGVRAAWGPITGIIHGAGVIADKRIVDKTEAQFRDVFTTKVDGMRALLAATATDPLAVLCAFSSVAARAGNVGQSDYAMANAALTALMHAEAARRGDACVVKAIHWGPWAGGMVDDALAARFRRAGVPLIPLDAGAEFLVRELGMRDGVEVVAGGGLRDSAAGTAPHSALAIA